MNIFHRILAKGKPTNFSLVRCTLERYQQICREAPVSENFREWESVVGLEVHAQINAKSKLFSSTPSVYGAPTNTEVSYFDAAFPGTLPVLNKYCVEAAVTTALALNCKVHDISKFDRKHYFYPDLPAGYQITQQFHPLASEGKINFLVYDKEKADCPYQCFAHLKQLQLEQDSGKSYHVKDGKSFVDLNRAGIGLMELVFEPNLKNGTEAAALVKELILILKRINTCSCDMEEGTLRVDANISVNKVGQPLGIRTEVKNINSLRYVARAVDHEINRQIRLIMDGGTVINETRAFDHETKTTVFMRDKEVLQDYRFMPEPNLPPIKLSPDSENSSSTDSVLVNIDGIKKHMPTLPDEERMSLIEQYKLSLEAADKLIQLEGARDKFEAVFQHISESEHVSNFLLNNVLAILNVRNLSFKSCKLTAAQLAELVQLIVSKGITEATANDVLEMLLNEDSRTAREIVAEYNWHRISDEKELETQCLRVMADLPKVTKKYRNTGRLRYMTSLLTRLYANTNNRAPYKESEEMFKQLILNRKEELK